MLAATLLAATTLPACVSARTAQTLDRSYGQAGSELKRAPHPPSTQRTAGEADFAAPFDVDAFVAQAVARSPALARMAHRARAVVHEGRAEGSLPAAEVGFEVQNLPMTRPYALGEAEMYMVELRQRFPAAGSLDARARAMAEEAQAMLAELSSEARMVAERATSAFADYVQALATQRLQQRQLGLLERMGQAVRARYTTGGTGLADAARIEVEVARARRMLARVDGELPRLQAMLNLLLRRAPNAALGPPLERPAETVRLPLDALFARAEASRGATRAADARLHAAAARRDAAQAEANVPEFMVGLGYWQHPSMRAGIGVTASMSLPWLWGPGSDRERQAEATWAAERAARDSAGLEAQTEIAEAHGRLGALEAQLQIVRIEALSAAQRSIEALAVAFATGNATLLEWVDASRSALDLEMEEIELRGELTRSVAGLERAVGAPLPRTRIEQDTSP